MVWLIWMFGWKRSLITSNLIGFVCIFAMEVCDRAIGIAALSI
ncbi:hypothetical protein [Chlorogloeopsis sp. ULAP02]